MCAHFDGAAHNPKVIHDRKRHAHNHLVALKQLKQDAGLDPATSSHLILGTARLINPSSKQGAEMHAPFSDLRSPATKGFRGQMTQRLAAFVR